MPFLKLSYLICVSLMLNTAGVRGQCSSGAQVNFLINTLDADQDLKSADKLKQLDLLKLEFERCNYARDSVYAKILHKIGFIEYSLNNFHPTPNSIKYTLESIRINTSGKTMCDPAFATKSYNNLSLFYKLAGLNTEASKYYDSTVQYAQRFSTYQHFILPARYERFTIFFQQGDYQRCIEEATLGFRDALGVSDTFYMISFINQRAQSYLFQGVYTRADEDALLSVRYAVKAQRDYAVALGDKDAEQYRKKIWYELASSYKIRALSGDTANRERVNLLIDTAIACRIKSGDQGAIADDYIDYGTYFFTYYKDYKKAKTNYLKSIEYSSGSKIRLAFAHLNLGAASFGQANYAEAEKNYLYCLNDLAIHITSILDNPRLEQISRIREKELIHVFLNNKTELLLCRYRQTHDPAFLKACLQTSMLTDSLIKSMRHEQTGEQSQLFWRKRTREFFTNALEACFYSNDPALAFYFMESSRAVILGDKLNELGASSLLPPDEAMKERGLRASVLEKKQSISLMEPGTEKYDIKQADLLQTEQELLRFIKSFEIKYPSYYQYKYADEVPSLEELKKYLSANQQSFVHYFMGDTVTYVLGIWGNQSKMLRIGRDQFRLSQITELLGYVSDKQLLNNHYADFASLSHQLYTHLFAPLGLPKGRVVICPDNFLFPFEAFSTDASGKQMLIKDYAISYIYSARYLLKQFPEYVSSGNFIGFAPVSFRPGLGLADLTNSAVSLQDASANYHHPVMYTGREATRRSFLSNVGNYRTVTIFSHARANEGDEEPMLYMQDSVIRLSELQYLNHPGTRLVVLSACQTTAGRNATGEGIYSLARGFAAAGIPSVAATVWKADEETIYSISKLFHQYLSQGMRKDEALQKAKLEFMNGADREQMLPYYWANMIIMGKVEPLASEPSSKEWIWISAGAALLLICAGIIFKTKWRRHK